MIIPTRPEFERTVSYDVEEDPEAVVRVRAVGIKRRSQIDIGGALFEL
jgi:hypothetical protein